MKTFILTSFLAAVPTVQAFPSLAQRNPGAESYISPEIQIRARQLNSSEDNCGPIPCVFFDSEEQYVNVELVSANQYVAPGPGVIRGPCPRLNAAANHDFLPHNGVPNIGQNMFLADTISALLTWLLAIDGLGRAFGMGVDIAGFLAAFAVAIDGYVLRQTWSIGGLYPGSVLSGVGGQSILLTQQVRRGFFSNSSIYFATYLAKLSLTFIQSDAYLANGDAGEFSKTFNSITPFNNTCRLPCHGKIRASLQLG